MEQNEYEITKEFIFSFNEGSNDESGFKYPEKIPILKPKEKIKFKFYGVVEAITLYFGWNSPFANTHIHLLRKGENFEAEAEVSEHVPDGKYKFYVAIWNGKKIIIDDPDVIIRRNL